MKDKMKSAMLKLALCPGECDDSEVCKNCAYRGSKTCEEKLKLEVLELLDDSQLTSLHLKAFDLELRTTSLLHELGVPANLLGFRYLRETIRLAVADPTVVDAITSVLYPQVAKTFQTTPSRVERAIRHAVEVSWDRGDLDTLQRFFGYTVSNTKGKPTNSEYIALIADMLLLEMKREVK